jgi:toxin ParE1/3/4
MAKVKFTEPSEYDLIDIEYYIAVKLSNPQAAVRITDGIMKSAYGLEDFPEANPLANDILLASLGVRWTSFDNYNIFYRYEKQTDLVYIIRILYNRQDWQTILKPLLEEL